MYRRNRKKNTKVTHKYGLNDREINKTWKGMVSRRIIHTHCKPGTFMLKTRTNSSCVPCTNCRPHENVRRQCNGRKDTVCGGCRKGELRSFIFFEHLAKYRIFQYLIFSPLHFTKDH